MSHLIEFPETDVALDLNARTREYLAETEDGRTGALSFPFNVDAEKTVDSQTPFGSVGLGVLLLATGVGLWRRLNGGRPETAKGPR